MEKDKKNIIRLSRTDCLFAHNFRRQKCLGGALIVAFFAFFIYNVPGVAGCKESTVILHLFADKSRLMVNSKPGSRLHTIEDVRSNAVASKKDSRTSRAKLQQSLSDLVTPASFFLHNSFIINVFSLGNFIGPFERFAFFAYAPCVNEKLSSHRRGGLFSSIFFAYPVEDPPCVLVFSDCHPGGLLQNPAQMRRPHFRDVSMVSFLAGLTDFRTKSGIGGKLVDIVKTRDVACLHNNGRGGNRADSRDASKKPVNEFNFVKRENTLLNNSFNVREMTLKSNYLVKMNPTCQLSCCAEFIFLGANPLLRFVAGQLFRPRKVGLKGHPAKSFSGGCESLGNGMSQPDKFAEASYWLLGNVGCWNSLVINEKREKVSVISVGLAFPSSMRPDARRISEKHLPDNGSTSSQNH